MGTAAWLLPGPPAALSQGHSWLPCLQPVGRPPPPPASQARPESHEPLLPPAPSPSRQAVAARRPRALWGTESSGSEKPRLARTLHLSLEAPRGQSGKALTADFDPGPTLAPVGGLPTSHPGQDSGSRIHLQLHVPRSPCAGEQAPGVPQLLGSPGS